jgi:hypothetical protein
MYQVRQCQVHVRALQHDHRPNDPAGQSTFNPHSRSLWSQGDGGEGCVGNRRVVLEAHEALQHDPVA